VNLVVFDWLQHVVCVELMKKLTMTSEKVSLPC
jgi:hypothetical protein